MTKQKTITKRLVAAAITVFTLLFVVTVANAATDGNIIKFIMGGKEIEGDYNDYVDSDGYRRVTFKAVLPIYEENFAIIFDVDAPWGEGVTVITDETDPDFMDRARQYEAAHYPLDEKQGQVNAEDFGLVFKDSEICAIYLGDISKPPYSSFHAILGGEFKRTGAAAGKPSGWGGAVDEVDEDGLPTTGFHYDWENEIKTFKVSFFYYVGKE